MPHPGCDPCFGTCVIGRLNHGNLFQQTVDFGKGPNSRVTVFKALFEHARCPKTKQDIEQFVCVTAQECPREYGNVAGGCSQRAKSVPLGCISSLQLVNLVSDGVIEETVVHITADEVDGCKATNLL